MQNWTHQLQPNLAEQIGRYHYLYRQTNVAVHRIHAKIAQDHYYISHLELLQVVFHRMHGNILTKIKHVGWSDLTHIDWISVAK